MSTDTVIKDKMRLYVQGGFKPLAWRLFMRAFGTKTVVEVGNFSFTEYHDKGEVYVADCSTK